MTLSSSRVYQDRFNTHYYETDFKSLEEFLEIVRYDHCPAVVEGGRDKASFVRSEFLFGEVDGGLPIAAFKERFLGVCYFLNTSRSHQKEKNGVVADRYHVFFPLEECIEDVRELDLQLRELVRVYPFFDNQAKDATRFYYGNAETEAFYNPGRCLPLFTILNETPNRTIENVPTDTVFDGLVDSDTKIIMDRARPIWPVLYDSGFYNDRGPWISAMNAMKIEGFPFEDFLLICHKDERTLADAEYFWRTAKPNGSVGMGTVIEHLRHVAPEFQKKTVAPVRRIPEAIQGERQVTQTITYSPASLGYIPTSVIMPWHNWYQPHVKLKESTKKDKDGNKEKEPIRIPMASIENFRCLMKFYSITIKENLMKHKVEVTIPGMPVGEGKAENAPFGRIISALNINGLGMSDSHVKDYVLLMAHENAYHPARDYFESLSWDGNSRLDELMDTLGVDKKYEKDFPGFAKLLVRKWLISVVGAACAKDFKTRGVLVFQGEESIGKGSWFRNLFERSEFFLGESDIDPHNKDSVSKAISHLVSELSELEKVFKRDMPAIKAFITSEKDSIRMPYERREEDYPRRSVFCASVNKLNFIDPDEKGTRFFSVKVRYCNFNKLRYEIDRRQLWAEIYSLFKAGESWWLNKDEEDALSRVNGGHREIDDVTDAIQTHFDLEAPEHLRNRAYTATEIAERIGYKTANKMVINKIGACLRKFGIEYSRSSRGKRGFLMLEHEREQMELKSKHEPIIYNKEDDGKPPF